MTLKFGGCSEGDGSDLIFKAVYLLRRDERETEALQLDQEACVSGYNFYKCLKLLKKYMDI